MNIGRVLFSLLILIGALIYVVGLILVIVGVSTEPISGLVNVIGAALATNFGVVVGIQMGDQTQAVGGFGGFIKRLTKFSNKQLQDYAAILYLAVMVIGTIVFIIMLILGTDAVSLGYQLTLDLLYALVGATVAAFANLQKQ